jgi:hypothetical protein
MNLTSIAATQTNSVIPTGVRPSVFGWSNAVEEPAVRWRRQIAVLIFLAALLSGVAVAQDLPKGWRRPTKAETSDDWRNKSRARFLTVTGDFDGDGQPDLAELLVNPSLKRWAVFVKLHSTGRWQRIGDENEMDWLGNMGIAPVKPGKYETACGKGYGDEFCAHGEPKYLKLATDAIDMFAEESADSMVYWDQKKQVFRLIQMSD